MIAMVVRVQYEQCLHKCIHGSAKQKTSVYTSKRKMCKKKITDTQRHTSLDIGVHTRLVGHIIVCGMIGNQRESSFQSSDRKKKKSEED